MARHLNTLLARAFLARPILRGAIAAVVAIGLTATVASAQAGALPPPGMISWWAADGNATDRVGSNDGTLLGGMGFATGYVTDGTGQAFSFDGVDDRVEVPDDASLDSPALSAAAWIKIDGFGCSGSGAMRILEKLGTGTGWTLSINCDSAPSLPRTLYVESRNQYNTFNEPVSDPVLVADTWTHVGFTYDGVGELSVYIDGDVVHEESWAPGLQGPMTSNSESLKIGYSSCCRFDGLIDEVQLFDHAITQEQMAGLYSAGTAGTLRDACPFYSADDAVEAITGLVDLVEDYNIQQGISNSLDAKLTSALDALSDLNENNNGSAVNKIEAFLNEVDAQRGDKLTEEQADDLTECGTLARWYAELE